MSMLPATLSQGRAMESGADGTYLIVQDGYVRGRKHQWGAELWRNGVQAVERTIASGGKLRGNEEIMFDFVPFDFVNDKAKPIHQAWKRRVWNNAEPMDKTELMRFFSTLGKGSGPNRFSKTNLSGQYGRGSRFAVLGHSNMMVCTTQPGGGTDALLIFDTGVDTYTLANFSFPQRGSDEDLADMREDCYLDLGGNRYLWMTEDDLIHPTVIRDGGVTTILTGPDIFGTYVEGDPDRGESGRVLVTDMTKWVNSPLPVTVNYLFEPTKGNKRTQGKVITIDGSPRRLEPRSLYSYDDWFARVPVGNRATVDLHNPDGSITEADVYLLPEDWNWEGPLTAQELAACRRNNATRGKKSIDFFERNGQWFKIIPEKDSWFPWTGKGFVVHQYDYEMLPFIDIPGITRPQVMKQWGINIQPVQERFALVLRSPKLQQVGSGSTWGVQQTGSRGSLTGPNEGPLPIDDWTNEFYELLQSDPALDFLRKALLEANPTVLRRIDPADLKRMEKDLSGRLDLANPVDITVSTKKNTGVQGEEDADETETNPDHTNSKRRIIRPTKTNRKLANPNSKNMNTNVETRTVNSTPSFVFLTDKEWIAKGKLDASYDSDTYCVVERGVGTTLYFNMGHELYVAQRTYYCTGPYFREKNIMPKFKRAKLVDLEQAVQDAYATFGISLVLYASHRSKKPNGHLDGHKFDEKVSGERMTDSLGSLPAVDYAIRHRIGILVR